MTFVPVIYPEISSLESTPRKPEGAKEGLSGVKSWLKGEPSWMSHIWEWHFDFAGTCFGILWVSKACGRVYLKLVAL